MWLSKSLQLFPSSATSVIIVCEPYNLVISDSATCAVILVMVRTGVGANSVSQPAVIANCQSDRKIANSKA